MKPNGRLEKAIIIHGPGRSGTTLLSGILSTHPQLGWISSWVNKYPLFVFLSFFNRLYYVPLLGKLGPGKKYFPKPTEPYHFLKTYFPTFNAHEKAEEKNTETTLKALRSVLTWSGKKRFLLKITGQSRAASIDVLFENPYVIWIDRNPKSVIMSYITNSDGVTKTNLKSFLVCPKRNCLGSIHENMPIFRKKRRNSSNSVLRRFPMSV
ncbi:MAG: sulfotransferase [Bacteroidetes bacterium]|nr:sulfotransferase [Bacteroidota bacterium]